MSTHHDILCINPSNIIAMHGQKLIFCEFVWYDDLNLVLMTFCEPPGNSKRSQISLSREISLNPGKLVIMSRLQGFVKYMGNAR